jgi:hypothetical protein
LSGTCCGHDALDWLAAVGPTLATLVASGIAWSAYRSNETTQRLLVRPRLGFRHGIVPAPPPSAAFTWAIALRNHGQSAAKILQVDVLVDGTVIAPSPLEQPGEYWTRIIKLVGVFPQTNTLFLGWTINAPESLGAGVEQPLVSGTVLGPVPAIQGLATRIEVRVTYESAFNDSWVESSKSGEIPSP